MNRLQQTAQVLSNALVDQHANRISGENEEPFRSLIENSTVGIYRTTPDGRILMANPALVRMLGYADFGALASRDLQGEGFEPSYAREIFLEHIEKKGEVIGLEASWKKQDGSVIWVRESARAIRHLDGRTLFYDGVVEDITQRKEQEQSLAESEEKFAKAFKCSPQPFVLSTLGEGKYLEVNDAFVQQTGWSRAETIGHITAELRVWESPAEREEVVARLLRGEPVANFECRLRKKNGDMFSALVSAERLEIRGMQCTVMSAVDVTERKAAENALRELSGRLISAQEEERRRVARELHDDIGQRLALVAVHLDRGRHDSQVSSEAMRVVIEEAIKQISDLASDMHSMSHRLHSSKLDTQGLAAAAAGFCRELSQGQNVLVDFRSEDIPKTLPEDIALCLFRVLQEALQNATRHSGTKQFWVALLGSTNRIVLTVRDEGRGFRPEEALRKRGLGLTNMMERLKLVGGELSIDAKPQLGTLIRASVPILFPREVRDSRDLIQLP